MKTLRRALATLCVGATLALSSLAASAAAVTQLGFILDASGSVSTANYNLLRAGLNAALAGIPLDGTVEITVVSYSSSAATVVTPTILTAATLSTIQTAISTHAKSSGNTATGAAITHMTSLLTASDNFADPGTRSLINLATDGAPTIGSPSGQQAFINAAAAANAAGIDALSIEAIGSGVSSPWALNAMAAAIFPGPGQILAVNETNIPNPLGGSGSWVVPVSDFDALAPVLFAKVQASITPPNDVPEPGTLALFSVALLGLAASRRRVR